MLSVLIVAPYTRSETTLAAIQLADWLRRIGLQVYFVSTTKVHNGIHKHWDNNAIRMGNLTWRNKAIAMATHVCYFTHNKTIARYVDVADTEKHQKKVIYFPGCIDYRDYGPYLREADRVICLSHALSDWLGLRYPQLDRTWATLVSPDKLLVPRQGSLDLHTFNFLVYVPKTIELDVNLSYLQIFHEIIKRHNVRLGFLFEKPLNKRYRKEFNKLQREYPNIVTLYHNVPVYNYGPIIRRHDVIYTMNTRHTHGSIFSLLNVYNTPIIGNLVDPAIEHILANVSCMLSTKLHLKPVPVAEISSDNLLDALNYICNNFQPWLKATQEKQLAQLKRAQTVFEKFLRHEFSI